MASIFSRIVAGEIPCHKVAENEEFFAFLDINPVAVGHTLVIPKKEIDYIFDIEDPMLGRMMAFAKRVARAQEAVIPCKRVGLAVMGLEVPLICILAERKWRLLRTCSQTPLHG